MFKNECNPNEKPKKEKNVEKSNESLLNLNT